MNLHIIKKHERDNSERFKNTSAIIRGKDKATTLFQYSYFQKFTLQITNNHYKSFCKILYKTIISYFFFYHHF